MKYLEKFFLLSLYLVFSALSSIADEKSVIRNVENYLNSFQTITAKFRQVTSDNNIAKAGVLYISRPGKLRFEYITPKKTTIVLNNNTIMYHEHELDETSYTKEKNHFFKLLASKRIKLHNNVDKVISDKNNISLHITSHTNNTNTDVIIIFDANPITLREMIFNNEAQETYHLSFYDIRYNKSLNRKLFSVQKSKFDDDPLTANS